MASFFIAKIYSLRLQKKDKGASLMIALIKKQKGAVA